MTPETTAAAVGVSIENLSLSFGDTEVLRGINLEIEPGELFTFLGPSGIGQIDLAARGCRLRTRADGANPDRRRRG